MIRSLFPALTVAANLFAQVPSVPEAPLRAHLAFLADDLMEGRGTGQRGGRLAARYLETQLQVLGLKPGFGNAYLQPVKFLGIRTLPERTRLTFQTPAGDLGLQWDQDYLVGSGLPNPEIPVDAPMVFVGHGITMDGQDDFKGLDVKGKVLLVLVGTHTGTAALPGSPGQFAGRWSYKIAEARRRGAAGVLLIHTTDRAGYDWTVVRSGWIGERFHLDPADPDSPLQGWITESAARRLFQASGQNFEALSVAAQNRDFRPVPLATRLKGSLTSAVRRFEDMNVAGLLPGTDPGLADEVVVYSAHWDHLGLDPASGTIFRGAVDNASGCAGVLAIAQVLATHPGRRSQLFLFTCAEEPGLLGAEAFLAANPDLRKRIVADLNLESLNFAGPTRDIGLAGSEASTLHDEALRTAQALGLTVTPPAPDPTGLLFRADHFAFVKAGIPAFSPGFSLSGGWDYLDPAQGARAKAFVVRGYHQPADAYDPTWDLRGMLQQVQFALTLGCNLADASERPRWKQAPPRFERPGPSASSH
jgi:Zn-dependent M28 family amino/carboxypeptidase